MENLNFNYVAALARLLQTPVAVYDLETTTFRGRLNFGVTEVSCFVVAPDGSGARFGDLINPERSIDPRASELTGITQSMVRGKETWGQKYAGLFAKLAAGGAWVAGFNNITFDNPAVVEMNGRYGQPFEKFTHTFDTRSLHKKLSGVKGTGGKLPEIAGLYGVLPRGNLHRAGADVALTLELLNAMVEVYGVEAVAEHILEKPKVKGVRTSSTDGSFTTSALVTFVKKKSQLTLEQVAEAFGRDVRAVSFEVGKAIDERLVDPRVFAVSVAQDWLGEALMELDTGLLTQGKLKPLHERLNQGSPVGEVDYVQLRIGMLQAGLTWASLKPV